MPASDTAPFPHAPSVVADAPDDDRHILRDPLEIRGLMQALVRQRAIVTVHPDGRGESFPSAVLDVEDGVLLDGSPLPAVNARAAAAGFLLCFAQVDRIMLRFRLERPRQQEQGGYVAFRTALPEELYHPQRRGLFRLETDVGNSPWCRFPDPDGGEPMRLRVVDISAGGLAVLLPPGQGGLEPGQRHAGCALELPGDAELLVTLMACSVSTRTGADGIERQRVGLRFEDLPRGADAAIQRHIFRVARERRARMNGDG